MPGKTTVRALPPDHPYAERATVRQLRREKGTVVLLDAVNLGIEQANGAVLLPLNLPAAFAKTGTTIVFSGALKQPGLTELMAGQPLVLTEIEKQQG